MKVVIVLLIILNLTTGEDSPSVNVPNLRKVQESIKKGFDLLKENIDTTNTEKDRSMTKFLVNLATSFAQTNKENSPEKLLRESENLPGGKLLNDLPIKENEMLMNSIVNKDEL